MLQNLFTELTSSANLSVGCTKIHLQRLSSVSGPSTSNLDRCALEEGWTRPQQNRRRHPLIGADGVVKNISDHPVCASKVASQLFLIAQPPLLWRRGLA